MPDQALRPSLALLLAILLVGGGLLLARALQPAQAPLAPAVGVAATLIGLGAVVFAGRTCAELRRVKAEFRCSADRERSFLDGTGEAIIVIDDQARIATFNRAAERMFGYEAGEIIGTSLERLMTTGARQAHAAYLAQHGVTAMVEAVRLRTVHKGVRKQGEVFPFELTMTEWADAGRRMFTGAMRDVSDRERAASALRESQARFAGLYENSAELLFIYGVEGDGGFVLESMNRAAEIYTGFPRAAVAGRTPDDFARPDEARALKRALLQCLDTQAVVPHVFNLSIRGEPRTLQVTISPMRNAAGEITRVLATGRDNSLPVHRTESVPQAA